jgi:phosphatidylethanolamine-binding protein (PEBP) family uncharacterized protein
MKKIIKFGIMSLAVISLTACHKGEVNIAKTMNVEFSDSKWDGKIIPKAEVCKWAGGNGSTPELSISNIPSGTEKLIVLFNDKTYTKMDNGGHGQIGINISANQTNITIPSIQGETKIMPNNMFIHKEHIGLKRGKAGAYLPPCSGGKGNTYSATIKALDKNNQTLISKDITMGKF